VLKWSGRSRQQRAVACCTCKASQSWPGGQGLLQAVFAATFNKSLGIALGLAHMMHLTVAWVIHGVHTHHTTASSHSCCCFMLQLHVHKLTLEGPSNGVKQLGMKLPVVERHIPALAAPSAQHGTAEALGNESTEWPISDRYGAVAGTRRTRRTSHSDRCRHP